jgi:hypothetical protein
MPTLRHDGKNIVNDFLLRFRGQQHHGDSDDDRADFTDDRSWQHLANTLDVTFENTHVRKFAAQSGRQLRVDLTQDRRGDRLVATPDARPSRRGAEKKLGLYIIPEKVDGRGRGCRLN